MPFLDDASVFLTNTRDVKQSGALQASQLSQLMTTGEEAQEAQVAHILADSAKLRTNTACRSDCIRLTTRTLSFTSCLRRRLRCFNLLLTGGVDTTFWSVSFVSGK